MEDIVGHEMTTNANNRPSSTNTESLRQLLIPTARFPSYGYTILIGFCLALAAEGETPKNPPPIRHQIRLKYAKRRPLPPFASSPATRR